MFKVRFHLGRGPYYKYWQIVDLKDKDAGPKYINTETSQLVLLDCELVCNENKARKVYSRGVKDVCGWIKCEHVHWHHITVHPIINIEMFNRIYFNPIVDPNWTMTGLDYPINGLKIDELVTCGNRVYTRYNSVAIENIYSLQHAPC
jgi:hypothetical protein